MRASTHSRHPRFASWSLLAIASLAVLLPVGATSQDDFVHVRRSGLVEEVEEWPRATVEFGRRHMAETMRQIERNELAKRQSSGVVSPAVDKFYIPPSGFGSKASGAIIRSRAVTVQGLSGGFFDAGTPVSAWQILYRTVSENTTVPIATVTTLIVPQSSPQLDRLVSYSLPMDAVNPICRPSYITQTGSNWVEPSFKDFLKQGYPITTSDYEGPDDAFGAGHLNGHAIMDSVRASLKFKSSASGASFSGFKSNTKVAIYGYSGGAFAAGWAAAVQPEYAPEINLVGAAFGGTPANLTSVLVLQDGTALAGFGFIGVGGLTRAFSSLANIFAKNITPAGKQALEDLASGCLTTILSKLSGKKFLGFEFQKLGPAILQEKTVKSTLNSVTLGYAKKDTPKVPLYIFAADDDNIVPVSNSDNMVKGFCNHGAPSVTYFRAQGANGHIGLPFVSVSASSAFINDRFAGKTPLKGCKTTMGRY